MGSEDRLVETFMTNYFFQVHDEFYKELHDCFGLESCIKQANMLGGPPQSKWEEFFFRDAVV